MEFSKENLLQVLWQSGSPLRRCEHIKIYTNNLADLAEALVKKWGVDHLGEGLTKRLAAGQTDELTSLYGVPIICDPQMSRNRVEVRSSDILVF